MKSWDLQQYISHYCNGIFTDDLIIPLTDCLTERQTIRDTEQRSLRYYVEKSTENWLIQVHMITKMCGDVVSKENDSLYMKH